MKLRAALENAYAELKAPRPVSSPGLRCLRRLAGACSSSHDRASPALPADRPASAHWPRRSPVLVLPAGPTFFSAILALSLFPLSPRTSELRGHLSPRPRCLSVRSALAVRLSALAHARPLLSSLLSPGLLSAPPRNPPLARASLPSPAFILCPLVPTPVRSCRSPSAPSPLPGKAVFSPRPVRFVPVLSRCLLLLSRPCTACPLLLSGLALVASWRRPASSHLLLLFPIRLRRAQGGCPSASRPGGQVLNAVDAASAATVTSKAGEAAAAGQGAMSRRRLLGEAVGRDSRRTSRVRVWDLGFWSPRFA